MTLALELPAPTNSALRAFDPRWKTAATVLCVVAVLVPHHLGPLLAAFLATLLLCRVARLPWRWFRARISLLLPLLAGLVVLLPLVLHDGGPALTLVGPVRVSLYGLVAAIRLALKALSVLTLMLILLGTTPLPDLLRAAHALCVPGFLVQLVALTFRYLMLLVEEFGRLRTALRVRGFRNRADLHSYRVVGNVTGTLLVRSLERAERVGQALRCRGFDGRFRCLTAFRTRRADVLWFGALVAAAAAVVSWDLLLR
jgi:cobalt/nickel transport system permease protein